MNSATFEPVEEIIVGLGERSYPIQIGEGILEAADRLLEGCIAERSVLLVSDNNVAPLYLDSIHDRFVRRASSVDAIVVPAGESSKSLEVCQRLWNEMLELGVARDTVVLALGGGVIGDLAGFLAATFTRGLDFLQIPTSLLAQVDSSVGGKVGVNLPTAKNMVGAFWQPRHVLIDTAVLATLDDRNFSAGMAEVIKYGVIMDEPLLTFLEQNVDAILNKEGPVLAKMIAWCCRCKAKVVQEDETERSGRRAILNYGHTFGHGIEAVFGYGEFLHGEAIAIGMTVAARLAVQLGMVDPSFQTRQTRLFEAFGLPTDCPADRDRQWVAAMKSDKKVSRGKLNLILPTRFGEVVTLPAPDDEVLLSILHPEGGAQ